MARGMRNIPRSKPTKPTLAGLEWHESHGCFGTSVNNWLNLSFSYDGVNGGYIIEVSGHEINSRAKDPEEAASLAIKAAKLWLSRATEKLNALEIETPEQSS